jgi:putative acetyltransferase
MAAGEIAPDVPSAPDVRALLARHLELMHAESPPEDVHALDVSGLLDPSVAFFSFRRDGELLGVGALKRLDEGHGEVKSMHTVASARHQGVGRAILEHLISEAVRCGYRTLSLETGTTPAFAPALGLYARTGFTFCGPFGDYKESEFSCFMTMELSAEGEGREAGALRRPGG